MIPLKTFCVYKHTNTENGKSYIGMCNEMKPEKRWANGKGYKGQKIGEAIEKYGWDKFEHKILFGGLEYDEAIKLESLCISLFRTAEPEYGYNVSTRGDKPFYGQHHTEDAKKRISTKLKQHCFTEEHRKHISEKKSGVLHHCAKPVYQYSLGGDLLKIWPYMNKAAQELGINKGNISANCIGLRKTAGGFVWSYERG